MVDISGLTVAELLERSRAAHRAYQTAKPRTTPGAPRAGVSPGDPAKALEKLDEAATYRKAAEELDPDFSDPAWRADGSAIGCRHEDLLTFYAEQVAKGGGNG